MELELDDNTELEEVANPVTVKSMNDDEIVLEGYGVVFNTEDLHGEMFTPETDLMLDNVKAVPVLWEHTATGVKDILGFAKHVRTDDFGVLFELTLKRSNKYVEMIRKFVERGRLGLSTGALPQTIQREGTVIKRWQVGELTATVTPAEFRTLGVQQIKSEMKAESSQESTEVLAELPEIIEEVVEVKSENIVIVEEKMETVVENEAVVTKSQFDSVQAQLARVMELLESTPAAKAGYITSAGGADDANVKSFGDWLTAVKRGDEKRLTTVYHSVKDLGEGSGSAGGYLVPTEYAQNLLQVAASQNQVYNRVQKVPVNVESGTYPALDQYITPTAGSGQTPYAAGVTAALTQAGATFTETEPKFSMLNWRLSKIGGITEVENELVEDSPFAIEALLRGLFALAIAAKNERNILRGTGVGEPLGILNSPCAVSVSDATNAKFTWADVAAMYSHFKGVGGQPVWLIHPSIWGQVMVMSNGTDAVWQANTQAGPANVLNGYPIIVSEHLPQAGQTGAVILADLSAYLMFERSGLSIAYSSEVGFTKDMGTFRFKVRNDGKSWLRGPIVLPDPQGSYSVSPFVYLTVD